MHALTHNIGALFLAKPRLGSLSLSLTIGLRRAPARPPALHSLSAGGLAAFFRPFPPPSAVAHKLSNK